MKNLALLVVVIRFNDDSWYFWLAFLNHLVYPVAGACQLMFTKLHHILLLCL